MYIGTLSKRTGASRKALYLYERLGLIPTPARRGTYRIYDASAERIVALIKCAQSLGFGLKELAGVLQGEGSEAGGQEPDVARLQGLIARKQAALRAQIEEAERRVAELEELRQGLATVGGEWACARADAGHA